MAVERLCATLSGLTGAPAGAVSSIETAATEIAAFFGVRSHEVAFFASTPAGFEFRWPPNSSHAVIPVKMVASSLVARTASSGESFVDNAFHDRKHLHVFEHTLEDRGSRIPVQKIMSVPVRSGERVAGVVQVSRKGIRNDEAGPDFTAEDLSALRSIAPLLSAFL